MTNTVISFRMLKSQGTLSRKVSFRAARKRSPIENRLPWRELRVIILQDLSMRSESGPASEVGQERVRRNTLYFSLFSFQLSNSSSSHYTLHHSSSMAKGTSHPSFTSCPAIMRPLLFSFFFLSLSHHPLSLHQSVTLISKSSNSSTQLPPARGTRKRRKGHRRWIVLLWPRGWR